ncbi:MAG: hypothetical protein ABIH25_02460, partial [Candidatus Woesearchaeota archaeon]
MKNTKPLNQKQVTKLLNQINQQFNCDIKNLKNNYYFLLTKKEKINIINKDISKLDTKSLNIMNIGIYFCKPEKEGIRLSIEGSQLIKNPKKNIITLNQEQFNKFMKGEDLEIKDTNGYKLIKYKED